MARRIYQAGYVYQRGKPKSAKWNPELPAYVRYWTDAAGEKRHSFLSLGICRTRTIAERQAAIRLEQLGVNSTQSFIESTSTVTFRQQGERWLQSLTTRKRNPLEQTTIDNRRYALDKWLYPFLGSRTLGEVNNRAMRELVEYMSALSPASIRDYSQIAKSVVASAIDENGEELYPRKWNEEYIDAPPIRHQNQISVDAAGVEKIIASVESQTRLLYALLAGCGPLRVGEALGLDLEHISEDCRTLSIRQKAKRGLIQPFLKTQAGEREVDLCSELAMMLRAFIGSRTSGLLFATASGRQLLQSNTLQDSLHPILKKLELPMGGFNIFRRFRLTHVAKSECPDHLRRFWSGHAQLHVEQRYIRMLMDRAYRLEWAERIGMDFALPAGQPGQLVVMRKSA